MIQYPIFFQTKDNFWYLYSCSKRRIILIDEKIKDFYDKEMSQSETESVSHRNKSHYLSKNYYSYLKYQLLKNSGFLDPLDTKALVSKRYTPNDILFCISNATQITFEVTDKCNLKCTYCAYGEMYDNYDQRETGMMDFKTAKVLIDYYIDKHNSHYNYSFNRNISIGFYGGEPLLNFKLIAQIVEYIRTKEFKNGLISYSITTNGLLLEKYFSFLTNNHFKILVSLDGNKESNSYRIRKDGKPSFDELFNSLIKLKKKYPREFKKYISFNSVLHNRNKIDEINEFFHKNFNKAPRISQISYNGISINRVAEFIEMYQDKFSSSNDLVNLSSCDSETFISSPKVHKLTDLVFKYSGGVYMYYSDFIDGPLDISHYPTGTCVPFSRNIYLTVGGKIVQCERIGHEVSMGRVVDGCVNVDYQNIANTFNTRFDLLRKYCLNCYNLFLCTKCVFQVDAIVNENQTECKRFLNRNEFTEVLRELMNSFIDEPKLFPRITSEIRISI